MRTISPTDIERLRHAVEARVNRRLQSPADFDWCSLRIAEQAGERISPTTLKRLWGYLDEGHTPRLSTLSSLARFLGMTDWNAWCAGGDSGFIADQTLAVKDLTVGDRIELSWLPDRWCVVAFRGDTNFVVQDIRHAKLPAGATFEATVFATGHSLYMSGTMPDGSGFTYVAGRSHGLRGVKLLKR